MSEEDDRDILDTVTRICNECADLSSDDRLFVLLLAWMAIASNARTAEMFRPNGFQEQQQRQVTQLKKILAMVETDVPDVEMERLYHDRDWAGMAAHIKNLFEHEGEKGGA